MSLGPTEITGLLCTYYYEEIQRILKAELRYQGFKALEKSLNPPPLQRPMRWNKLDMHRALRVSEDGLAIFLEGIHYLIRSLRFNSDVANEVTL